MDVSKAPTYESKCTKTGCTGTEVVIKKEPTGSRHYARAICTKCHKHNQWITKPENIKLNDPRASAILCYKFMLDNRPKLDLKPKK